MEILRWIERQVAAAQPGADAQTMAPSPAAARPTTPVSADDLVLAEPVSGATEADPRTTARTGLASVALALVGRGLGDEVGLLERARELRARIESPDDQSVHRSKRADPTATPPTTAVGEVRAAFLAAPPGSPLRTELLRWIQPGLLGTVDLVVAEAARSVPEPVEVRTPGGVVEVSAAGAPLEVRQRAETRAQQLESARLRTVEETQQLAVALRDRLAVPVG